MSGQYWLIKEPKDIIGRLEDMHSHWNTTGTNPVFAAWTRNNILYNSAVVDVYSWDTSLQFEGDQGELVKMVIPIARSLTRQMATLVTKNKLAFQAISESRSQDAVKATRLANALAQQIVQEENLNGKGFNLVEQSLVSGAGFVHTRWRDDKGNFVAVGDQGEIIADGQVDITNVNVFDCFYDYTMQSWEELNWVEVRDRVNKYDIIAQHPELQDEIEKIDSFNQNSGLYGQGNRTQYQDDMIWLYTLYHKPTPALPKGRMIIYCTDEAVLYDGPNPYECIPVEPMMPEKINGSLYGYPRFSDVTAAQEMYDMAFSTIGTNIAATGVQNVAVPRGSGIDVQDILGMNFISYTPQNVPGGGKPEGLLLTKTPAEAFKYIEFLQSAMELTSEMNSTLRGNPPAGVTSGVAIATLSTNALEFMNQIFKSYSICMERTMNHAIKAYAKFAATPHPVVIDHMKGVARVDKFVGEELKSIRRFNIQMANPILQTAAGRLDIAEKLIQSGLITTPKDYINILEGEPINMLYENELSENNLIQSENEMLMSGEPPTMLRTDDHPLHIRKHKALLDDQDIRKNSEYVKIILDHIAEHEEMELQLDPRLKMMSRAAMMPQGGPPPPQAPQVEGQAGGVVDKLSDVGPLADAQPAEPQEDMLGRR